jgi:serine/threonine-protein kinase SRPK3
LYLTQRRSLSQRLSLQSHLELAHRFASHRYGAKYLAAKILSLDGTEQHRKGVMHELEILKTIKKQDDINSLPILYDTFEVEGPRGSHLCFLMNLLSSDVSSFRRNAPNKALKPYIVKNIISQVLEALVQLHSLDIIHTGADN